MSVLETTWRGASAIVDAARVARVGAWYVVESRLREMSKWPLAILTQSFLNPVLYLTAVGIGIGSLVDTDIDGVSYLTFLAPALLAAAAIQAASDEVVFPTLEGFKWRKTFFATNATPLTPGQIANGVLFAAMFRVLLASGAYFIVLALFGAATEPTSWLSIPAAMLAGFSFGSVMLAVTAYVYNDDQFMNILGRFVITPLFLFSGTYYPLESMPIYLQPIGWVSPLWHAVEIGRFLTYGAPVSTTMLLVHIGYFVITSAAGLYFAHKKFFERLGV